MSSASTDATAGTAREGLIEIDGVGYYRVPDIDQMPPFLMSVVSDGDRWMFISSSGGLTAGRVDPAAALFPYETDDRLHRAGRSVGPVTAIRVSGTEEVWTPFVGSRPRGRRDLLKSVVGDSVVFEEEHPDLGLVFRYRWASCDRFGFVRTATLENRGRREVRLDLIDGLVGLLPHGLDPAVYQARSNLTHAYKRSQVIDDDISLAIYSLESRIVDRAEPAESLRCSAVWSVGLDSAAVTVSPDAVSSFEAGSTIDPVPLLTGRPGAYLLSAEIDLLPGSDETWHIGADVALDQRAVVELRHVLRSGLDPVRDIDAALRDASDGLVRIMAGADALQRTGDRVATAHQFSNVTYNVMRGGIPLSGYEIDAQDLADFLHTRNRAVAARRRSFIDALPVAVHRRDLLARAVETQDAELIRLCLEYLPFSFSRRHGDPSRPWNRFSIRVEDAEGSPVVYYEGNWRDIFQNWEALCMSFPDYLTGVISVFVNASTMDGFNPYRITRDGIDWEKPDPLDPWSNIGYWGDHQIVYLLRLLEAADHYLPGQIDELLAERWFSYADVPYRLADYDALVRDPHSTITYDDSAAQQSETRARRLGGDGRLVVGHDDAVLLVTLAEKLVVPALTKLSNFVPGGGIWMNTQRPEWNDANNALVGFGMSMVTLSHLRRYLDHLRRLLRRSGLDSLEFSAEITDWFREVEAAFDDVAADAAMADDRSRKSFMDRLGRAFSEYRQRVYGSGFSGRSSVRIADVAGLCDTAIDHLDSTVLRARRSDGLYHSYNLIHFSADGTEASVEHLPEMLEGQVAVLDSGVLPPEQRLEVIDALFRSAMYRPDQRSFMLYPVRTLPSFLEKNVVPAQAVEGDPLLSALHAAGNESVVTVDRDGRYRFNADFTNQRDLEAELDRLADEPEWSDLVRRQRNSVLEVFERVFDHHSYTGRSGSMYGYEGIGSIYWHMVAKLLVAVHDSLVDALAAGVSKAVVGRLAEAYWRVRSGLGFNKTAAEFGAIPIDPYSHSPLHAGAQQPGMTGLVKEELLTRRLEVGIRVEDGRIVVDPVLLRPRELLTGLEPWPVYGPDRELREVSVPPRSLGATICQVPVLVSATDGEPDVHVSFADGSTERLLGSTLDRATSAAVFSRTGHVERIHATVRLDL